MSPRLLWALACDLAGELAHVVVPPGGERRGSTGLCAGRNQHRMSQAQLAKCTETRLTAAFALC
jgi:hypothetical protein